ncbi:MAG: sugar transferase [Polyangiales bacterium]
MPPTEILREGLHARVQRVLDLGIALPALVASVPLLLMLASAIQRASPGPVVFTQPRIGRDGRPFRVYKLRTMYPDAEARLREALARAPEVRRRWLRRGWMPDDPRVAGRAARFARRYGLDELPQLWNVVRGEMSIVGPRPIEPYLAEGLFSRDEWDERNRVRPGLTGLWQVRRANPSVDSLRRFDLLYLRRRSVGLDLWILARTPGVLLQGRGA